MLKSKVEIYVATIISASKTMNLISIRYSI